MVSEFILTLIKKVKERSDVMATSSIFHNVNINTREEANQFIYALEKAKQWANEHKESKAPKYKTLSGEEIRKFFHERLK